LSKISLYGIYSARFPFLDSSEHKLRPIIVVSRPYGEYGVVAVVPLSSKTGLEVVDVGISGWRSAGLIVPSVARVHRLTVILQSRLITEMGMLEASDVKKLQESMRKFLSL
jgi:mRNA-degrading endonuclease toxin of MazEF toxin-antitoxin module